MAHARIDRGLGCSHVVDSQSKGTPMYHSSLHGDTIKVPGFWEANMHATAMYRSFFLDERCSKLPTGGILLVPLFLL